MKKQLCQRCFGNGFVTYGKDIRAIPHVGKDRELVKAWEGEMKKAFQCPWCGNPKSLRSLPNECIPRSIKPGA